MYVVIVWLCLDCLLAVDMLNHITNKSWKKYSNVDFVFVRNQFKSFPCFLFWLLFDRIHFYRH